MSHNKLKYQSQNYKENSSKKRFYKKKSFLIPVVILLIIFVGGGIMAFKTGYILNKISITNNSGLGSLIDLVGGNNEVKGSEDGRINILLLGMRGENMPGGGLLADTIMLASYKPDENKLALFSIPRDLYVKFPGTQRRAKINAVYAYGEETDKNSGGIKQMEKVVEEISGLPIHYGIVINFAGFKELINAVEGVEVYLETAFYETNQFVLGQECGTQFELPAGLNKLDGETALCYARARENTSDFDRAKRQQLIIKSLKDKLVSLGTLTDINKLNNILNAVGNNVKTDLSSGEMKKFYEDYSTIKDAEIYQRVFENSEEGLLMVPQDAPEGAGYILVPRAGWDNYSQIQEIVKNIFTLPTQTDIQPIKQYTRPVSTEEKKKKDKDEVSDEEEEKSEENE